MPAIPPDGFFQIKESPEGDWNLQHQRKCDGILDFQIKESPEGDWNALMQKVTGHGGGPFKLKNPRKGTETLSLS